MEFSSVKLRKNVWFVGRYSVFVRMFLHSIKCAWIFFFLLDKATVKSVFQHKDRIWNRYCTCLYISKLKTYLHSRDKYRYMNVFLHTLHCTVYKAYFFHTKTCRWVIFLTACIRRSSSAIRRQWAEASLPSLSMVLCRRKHFSSACGKEIFTSIFNVLLTLPLRLI